MINRDMLLDKRTFNLRRMTIPTVAKDRQDRPAPNTARIAKATIGRLLNVTPGLILPMFMLKKSR